MRRVAVMMGVVFLCGRAGAGIYAFTWGGEVQSIRNDIGVDVPLAGVSIGDTMVASVTYDPDTFAAGLSTSDGYDYVPPSGVQMTYAFTSGGLFTHDVTFVRARDDGSRDQWNWVGSGILLCQLNDSSGSSWTPPLPTSFAEMHTLFLNTLSNFQLSDGSWTIVKAAYPSVDAWNVDLENEWWSVEPAAVPVPGAFLLAGIGLSLAGWRWRRENR